MEPRVRTSFNWKEAARGSKVLTGVPITGFAPEFHGFPSLRLGVLIWNANFHH